MNIPSSKANNKAVPNRIGCLVIYTVGRSNVNPAIPINQANSSADEIVSSIILLAIV